MYSAEDKEEILRLAKVAVATQADMDSIYNLFKKYIRPNAVMYQINCNCNTSISKYYQLLLEWYSENANKFNIRIEDWQQEFGIKTIEPKKVSKKK